MIPNKWLKGQKRLDALAEFANQVDAISDTIGFKVSSRGWCYILEEKAGLLKGDFDRIEIPER